LSSSANPSAAVFFMLDDNVPLRLQAGGGQTLSVPASIAVPLRRLYLPSVMR
jgi:hypothetical protein